MVANLAQKKDESHNESGHINNFNYANGESICVVSKLM